MSKSRRFALRGCAVLFILFTFTYCILSSVGLAALIGQWVG